MPCTETAFLGIRKENGVPSTKLAIVPNALGQGWSDEFAHDVGVVGSASRDLMCCYSIGLRPSSMAYAGPDPTHITAMTVIELGLPEGFLGRETNEIVLFDSEKNPAEKISGLMTKVTINGAGLEALEMQIFVGDMSTARIRIGLRDMEGGLLERPINVLVNDGERVMIKLVGFVTTMAGILLKVAIA